MPHRSAPPDALELVDCIYGAACGEVPWAEFLERTCALLPGGQSVLFFHDAKYDAGAVSVSAGFDPGMVEKYNTTYATINPWMHHASERPIGRVVQADEMLPRCDLHRTHFYDEYLRPQDLETGLGVTLRREDGVNSLFSIVCGEASEEQIRDARQTIQAVIPHLHRALDLSRSAACTQTDEGRATGGVLRVGMNMRVISADARALQLIRQVDSLSIAASSRLRCDDAGLGEAIDSALSTHLYPASPAVVHHLYLKRAQGMLPLRACVYRPGGHGAPFFGGRECVIFLDDFAATLPDAIRTFCDMYRLSMAEGQIITGLAHGRSLQEIAAERGTSTGTARTQLKNVFAKTGCTRQAEIAQQVGAIAGASLPGFGRRQ